MASRVGPPLVTGLILCLLYAWGRGYLEPYRRFLMPGLGDLWEGAFASPAVLAELARASAETLRIALTGLAISIPFGMGIGVCAFRWRYLERAVFPYLVALQSIPILAIIPLLQSLLGFGFLPKVLIVALFTFFAIPTTLLLGLKSVDPGILDLFRLQGASWGVTLRKAGLPSALPALFAGLRISASMAVIGAIVSELFFVSGDGGLGQMLINAKADFQYEQMYAALLVSSLLSLGVYLFFSWLGRRLFSHWHP
ncbi:MAG: ABC transporter permease subunit [Gammaproteobacteria bacterium]